MDPSQKSQQMVRSFSVKRVYEFLEKMKQEFGKINWTDGENVGTYAKIVVVATFFFGMLIYMADVIVQWGISIVDMIFRSLFG